MGWLAKSTDQQDAEPWREKYYAELEKLKTAQALQEVLRRLSSRLCLAAMGQNTDLDRTLSDTQAAVRTGQDVKVFEQLMGELTRCIEHLDEEKPLQKSSVQAPVRTEGADSPLVTARKVLTEVMDQLDMQAMTAGRSKFLRAALFELKSEQELQLAITRLTGLIKQHERKLNEHIRYFKALFERVSQRLEDVTDHLDWDTHNREQGSENSQQLNDEIRDEMRDLTQVSKEASTLNELQRDVESKIARVGSHLSRFRDRERELAAAYRERADRLKERINQLEKQAVDLESEMRVQRERALTDPLTGIGNREAYEEAASQLFSDQAKTGAPLCLALWDIDHFKSINDRMGHPAGDQIIRVVAQFLSEALGPNSVTARVGGEEFVSLLPGLNLDKAAELLQKVRLHLERLEPEVDGVPVPVTVSCGVTAVQASDATDDAYARADQALYQAKRNGRNCVWLHSVDPQ